MDSRINYLLLGTALLGTFFSGTATRIVAISMPTVAQSLGTDLLGISWALLSYQLSNIGLSVVFGRISDLWGREKMFALGFVVFAMSSLLCGLSQTVLQLILAFEFHTGIKAAALTAENPAGFVAALNTTFLAAIVLCVAGVFTSALRGAPKPA